MQKLGHRREDAVRVPFCVLAGFYLGVGGTYQINAEWSLQAAGRYQCMDDFKLGDNGSNASLSFGSACVLSLGALYSL